MRNSGFLPRSIMGVVATVGMAISLVLGTTATTAFAAEHHTWHVTVGVQTSNGAISGMAFTPSNIFVKRGDTVVWTVGSKEIHTVSFGNPPADTDNEAAEGITNPIVNNFEEVEELFGKTAGGSSFTGTGYYNSGVMTQAPAASGFPGALQHYSLTINAPVGNYTFYCLVHGPIMTEVVHVIPNSQAYPFTQHQYNEQAEHQRAAIFAQGRRAWDRTEDNLAPNTVSVGFSVDAGQADLMRFVLKNTTVEVNTPVKFTNVSMDPHTVTIGSEAAMPFGGLVPFGNLSNVKLGQNVSSGVFGAAFAPLPTSVTFRFTQPGVYHYFCIFHDNQGMVGTITVVNDD